MALPLILGIKRKRARQSDAQADAADAALKAKRPGVLNRQRNTCQGCGYVGKQAVHLDVHHVDDDHQNNADENLALACHTCHPYQHIGELAKRTDAFGEGLGEQTRIATVPEISASDLNLLMRAMGVALNDPEEAKVAKRVLEVLARRMTVTKHTFGTYLPKDFAAGMAQLEHDQYMARSDVLRDQRLVFRDVLLQKFGTEFAADHPTLPLKAWSSVSERLLGAPGGQAQQQQK